MKNSVGLVVLAAVLAVGACGGQEQGAGGVTQEESDQLNEAAEMLDASPDSLTAPDEAGLGNADNGAAAAGEAPVSADNAATNGR